MGEFTYEEQGTYTWLVYGMEDDEEIDSLSLGMLTKNRVPGILPIVYTPINNTGFIKYNVSSRVSARDYLTGMVNRERMLGVFNGIISAMTSAESYMLDVNSLILDLDYIFVNVSTRETNMICVPVMVKEQKHMDLAGFFRNILFTVQFDPSENFDYVTLIVNYLNSTQMFSLTEFGKLVAGLQQPTGGGTVGTSPTGVSAYGNIPAERGKGTAGKKPSEDVRDSQAVPAPQQLHNSAPEEEFGGIMIPGSAGKVELPGISGGAKSKKLGFFDGLKSKHRSAEDRKTGKEGKDTKEKKKHAKSAEMPAYPQDIPMTDDETGLGIQYGATADDFEMPQVVALRLHYITEGRMIAISSFPFEIGREGSGLKIDVSKTKISRRHAVITQAGGQFLITDFSKHGTFLNGERIPQGEPRVLENGMRMLLKTEEFEVKIDRS